MSDLIKRLRNYRIGDYQVAEPLDECIEAADEIERLRAQNAALREALEKIAQQSPEPSNSYDPQHENYLRRVLIEIARTALEEK